MPPSGPVLFAYDASPHARAAIEQAGRLMRPGPAVVVTARSTLETAAAAALIALPSAIVSEAGAEIGANREDAEAIAAEGVRLAAAAGFEAQPKVIRSSGTVFAAIMACADELDAAAIILGSRGRSTLPETLLGGVSTGVLLHTARPVMVARTA